MLLLGGADGPKERPTTQGNLGGLLMKLSADDSKCLNGPQNNNICFDEINLSIEKSNSYHYLPLLSPMYILDGPYH